VFREERDVHDPDLTFPTRHIQPADRFTRALDYLERSAGIIFPVMRGLRIELAPVENGFLFVAPTGDPQFFRARARIKAGQKGIVFRRYRAKQDHGDEEISARGLRR
jgi:hypothetical protein